jgi:IS4 transposase
MLDYDGCLPTYLFVRPGKQSDLSFGKNLLLPKNSVVMIDRGYQDFGLFYHWHLEGITFVTRLKMGISHARKKEIPLSDSDSDNILVDEVIEMTGDDTKRKYSEELRRLVIWDEKNNENVVILTNNFSWTAETQSQLYRERWKIAIFFRYIKQNLKIKSFLGRSENAVFIQTWTALITFLLLKLLHERSKFKWHLSNLIHFVILNLFNKFDIYDWLDNPIRGQWLKPEKPLLLFSD